MDNRLIVAWQLRHDLHAWLREHPGSMMQQVFDAFPLQRPNTVRKTMQKLVRDLDVAMVNTVGNKGRYRAITEQIRPLAETVERVREAGRRNQHHAVRGYKAKIGTLDPIEAAIAEARAKLAALEKAKRAAEAKARAAARNEARKLERIKAREEKAREKSLRDACGTIEIAPGHIRHRPMARASDASSGGQGAVRPRVTINCSHNY